MEEWYCNRCKTRVEEKDVFLTYMGVKRLIKGLKCPQCGAAYLREEEVLKTVNPGEAIVEGKF